MSELDVHRIICPAYERELMDYRRRRPIIEEHVRQLRQMLRTYDPSLPNEYDGNAWAEILDVRGFSHNPERVGRCMPKPPDGGSL